MKRPTGRPTAAFIRPSTKPGFLGLIYRLDKSVVEARVDHNVTEIYILKLMYSSNINISLEASITKLTFYHIRCFLLSKDAFTPNLAEFGPVDS